MLRESKTPSLYTELFHRHSANPILTAQDWPYPAHTVFNAGACQVGDETILLVRVEDRRGHSHLTVARSNDGVSNWQVDSKPSFAPDPASRSAVASPIPLLAPVIATTLSVFKLSIQCYFVCFHKVPTCGAGNCSQKDKCCSKNVSVFPTFVLTPGPSAGVALCHKIKATNGKSNFYHRRFPRFWQIMGGSLFETRRQSGRHGEEPRLPRRP